MIHYFLDFAMSLDNDKELERGRLVLRSISAEGGRDHVAWEATSSQAHTQQPESFHKRGGPLPPAYRLFDVSPKKTYDVETKPISLLQTKGVEGSYYRILLNGSIRIKTDAGGIREDFGIHRDANVPGSMGCPVMTTERFKSFELQMKRLFDLGYSKIPLFVTYPN